MASRQTGSTTRSKLMAVRSRAGTTASVVLAVACGLAMSACAFQKDPKSKEKSKIEELEQQLDANRPLVKSDFKHEFIPGEKPHQYTARVTWPANRPLLVKFSGTDVLTKTVDGRSQNEFYLVCVGGKVNYSVDVISPVTGVLSNLVFDERCPVDAVVMSVTSTSSLPRVLDGRLFFLNGSGIILGSSETLELNVLELIVEGSATISTYKRDRASSLERDSRVLVASPISIRAKKATGLLKFELNGVDGGEWRNKPDVIDPALDGKPGKDGVIQAQCGKPSRLGDGAQFCRDVCTDPTNGENGKDAKDLMPDGTWKTRVGSQGFPGVRGIGTSNVELAITDASGFAAEFNLNPGLASRPGLGELPKGGKPGAPGTNPSNQCRTAGAGKPGADGIRGPVGESAPNGRCGTISISDSLKDKIRVNDLNPLLPCSRVPDLVRPI